MDAEQPKDWKLKLRYGKLKTPFKHYTVIAEGIVGQLVHGFSCRSGNAFMAMKTWSHCPGESADMLVAIGREIGFTVNAKVQIFETNPEQPPGEEPFGYDINFTPFDSDR
jgi:hypothetical protein